MRSFAVAISILFCFSSASANIKLPVLVSDGMILQRDTRLKIWGWGSPGEKLVLTFNGNKVNAVTGSDGKWLLWLPAMKAGGPFTMKIKGDNELTVNDILLGDVWFCSGQSNMELVMGSVNEKYGNEIAEANYPEIRQVFFPHLADVVNLHEDIPGTKWLPALPANVPRFSAAAYFFAKKIYLKYHVPIGIIHSSWGGTPIESWMSKEAIRAFPKYDSLIEKLKDTAYFNQVTKVAPPVVSPFAEPDKGSGGPVKWYDPAYVPQGWRPFWLPGYWADQGVKNLNGTVWFRKEINVPASMAGVPAKLYIGGVTNTENTFINGVSVGTVANIYPARRYDLPAGILKAGKNIIVIKLVNRSGKGGFVPGKEYALTAGDQRIDLRGDWEYKVGQVTEPRTTTTAFSMQNTATSLYNGMVHPAINYAVKGFLWYQGETNAGRPAEYLQLLPALINDWRKQWQQGDLPFVYVQLANYMDVQYAPAESSWAELRESQRKTLSLANTGMAVIIDAGNWNDIHPYNKKDVGERLALAAEHLAYDKKMVYSGPTLESTASENNRIILTFGNTGSGLLAKGNNELQYFAIAGADKKFVWARAVIEGNKVIVSHPYITAPVYVRYAWADNPEGANLYNKEGLPASSFETAADR